MIPTLLVFAIGANLGAAICNLIGAWRRDRLIRFLRAQIDKQTGAVAFASIIARDDSPVADAIRTLARRACPFWRDFDAIPLAPPPPTPPSTLRETVH